MSRSLKKGLFIDYKLAKKVAALSAEDRTACPGCEFWAVGEHPPDCHEFRGVLSLSFGNGISLGTPWECPFLFGKPRAGAR